MKGDVGEASNIMTVLAVKETPRTIPHCHPIPIEACSVRWDIEESGLRCTVTVRTHWSTGVEMEALCGVSHALLCTFDMLKSIEKDNDGQYHDTSIEGIRVIEKRKATAQLNDYLLLGVSMVTADFVDFFLEATENATVVRIPMEERRWQAADGATVEAMRAVFDKVPFDGRLL